MIGFGVLLSVLGSEPAGPRPEAADKAPSNRPEERVLRPSQPREYALSLERVTGIAPITPPGSRLELWVAWKPPVTRAPRIQRLLPSVTLQRIVPPVTPQGPLVAILLVDIDDMPDLLYAERYGSLSAAVVGPAR